MSLLNTSNKVFIATSMDGYIADKDGKVDFLETFPAPPGDDMGYSEFMSGIDAIVMGRNSFETVLSFNIPWPYKQAVFVWSNTMQALPESLPSNVSIVRGTVEEILPIIHQKGYYNLYIDGGKTIQSFLKERLINTMTITTIPLILGAGIPLFGPTNGIETFKCTNSKIFSNGLVQCIYERL